MKGKLFKKALAVATSVLMLSGGVPIQPLSQVFEDIAITASAEGEVNLSTLGSYTAQDGDVLTGSTSGTVTIANNAKITLSDVTITGGIVCAGTAEITLVGMNSVTGASQKAGIQVGGLGTTLTIKGNGSLTANGGDQSAGIGLSRAWKPANDVIGGDIIIEGGNITANGSVNDKWGAGIGTGVIYYGNGSAKTARIGNITIKGGSVKATGGSEADGIGTGYTYYGCTNTIGTVTIYDGIDKVDASSISESVTYMHVENETETDVTANKSDYFSIIEDGNRRVIAPKDDTDYTITIANGIEHGTLEGAATAKYMEKVTITATPALGYRFSRLVVKDAQNNDVASTDNSFFMPKSNVTVSAVFEQATHGTTEFAWGYIESGVFVTEATIYDGVTTVNLQQGKEYFIGKDYQESPEPGMGYYENTFRLDEDPYTEGRNIPYSGGTGSFMMGGYGKFRLNGDAGYYDITMTDVGNGKWNVSILKTAGQMDVVPDQTYTGSAITPEPTVIAGSLNLTKGTDYVYSYENNENVGTAKVIAIFQGTYAWLGYVEKEFTIVKATPTVNAPTAVENLIHNGSAQALVNAGSTDFGTLLYSLDGQNYSADIPTGTDAGTYTIYYKVEGSDNWNAVAAQTIQATILPSTVIVNVTGNGTVTYNDKSAASGETIGVTAEKGTDVTLTLAPESGYAVSIEYGYTNNSGTTASGFKLPINGTTATLTVPNDLKDGTYVNLTVTFVSALAGGADEASAVALTDNTVTNFAGGWYKVDSDITFDHTLNLLGDTHLIIDDGKTMTVNTATDRGILSDYTLFVISKGALNVATTDNYGIAVRVGNYVQTGATVTASGYIGIRCEDDFIGFDFDNDFTFSGGQLTATGSGGGGIDADNDITLSCTNATDFIQASSYSSAHGAVKIAEGNALTDGTEASNGMNGYSGTLTDEQITAIGGKALKLVATMDNIPDQTYTGSAITPEPTVIAGSLSLTKGTDYTYSYTNNTNVGTAKVTVTFKGDYASLGSVEKEFNIVRATPTVTAPTANTLTYNGNEQELVTAGSTDFGKVLYSLDGETYSEEVPKGTSVGDYTVYYKVEGSDNWNAVEPQTVTAKISYSDGIGARVEGYSLILGDDIGVNFYMELADDVKINTTAKMVFTIPDSGNTSTVELSVSDIVKDETKCVTAENGKTYYIFPCHVAAKEMTSTIKAQIVYTENGEEKSGTEYTYSVKQYADYILAKPDKYGAKAVNLVKAMLNYGAAAQTLFDHNTTKPANEGVTGLTTFDFPDDLNTCDLTKIKTDGLTLTNISLVLESKTTLRLYFTATSEALPVLKDSSGNVYTAVQKGNEYYYDITGFTPGEIFAKRSVMFAESENTAFDETKAFEVCIGNYANWAMNGTDDALKATIRALYNYDEYAKAYKDNTYIPGKGQGGGED